MKQTREQIQKTLEDIAVEKYNIKVENIDIDMPLVEQFGHDSMTITEMIIQIEEIIGFEFQEKDLYLIDTVANLITIIENYVD